MSEKESTFLRQLKLTLLIICGPTVILIVWGLVGMYFGERHMKETVEQNTESLRQMQKYYMTTQDFWNYFDAQKELYDAKINGNQDRIYRLETELDDFRNQFGIKTRNGTSKSQ